MIKKLRHKFVIIIMALVGTVLVSVLGSSYLSTYTTQRELTFEALDRSLRGDLHQLPRMGEGPEGPEERGANVLILAVEVDQDGVMLATNNAPVLIESEALQNVLDTVLSSEKETGWDSDLHVAWKCGRSSLDTWRVVIADTSAIDLSLAELAWKDLRIILAAMVVLFFISLGLSTWVLRPVERSWEQQRQFIADASHELKTPLAVILANAQILSHDEGVAPESQRWVSSTLDEATHMKNLVEELLELVRTDESAAGTQGIMRHEQVDFSEMVENATLEFDAIAFERGCELQGSVDEDVVVEGDPEWLERLCKILIDNACKYAQAGTSVTVDLRKEGRHCTLVVNNRGITIAPEDLPHVFDRFYRTDRARGRDGGTGGFGLGLAIAKGICTSHGGSIDVTSSDEAGTTFVVRLPLKG